MNTSQEGGNSNRDTTAAQVMSVIYLLLGGFVLMDFFGVRPRPERSHLLFNDDMTDRIAQRKSKPAESPLGYELWAMGYS